MTTPALLETDPLATAWAWLCVGHARVVRAYSDDAQHHLELAPSETPGLPRRELDVLLPVLLGKAQKVVAAEVLRSSSSVTGTAISALRRMGLVCRPNNVPMIAVMMARAAASLDRQTLEEGGIHREFGPRSVFLSVTRPDVWLGHPLTPSERKVLRLRIEGHSHDEVARTCMVSKRTVANQIASAYRKFGVSARLELLNRILDQSQALQVASYDPAPADLRLARRFGTG